MNDNKNKAIASLALGCFSILLMFAGVGAIVGVICAIIAIMLAKDIRKEESDAKTYAVVGFITGVISLILNVIALILVILALTVGFSMFNEVKDKADDQFNDVLDKLDTDLDNNKDNDNDNKDDDQNSDIVDTLTADEFTAIMKSKNFTIHDLTDNYQADFYDKVLVARDSTNTYQVDYYLTKTALNSNVVYNELVTSNETSLTGNITKDSASNGNEKMQSYVTDTQFSKILMNEKVVLYAEGNIEYKDVVYNIFKDLGFEN